MAFFSAFSKDNIQRGQPNRVDPASTAINITLSDSTVYDPPLRGISVGTGGQVAVLSYDNNLKGLNTATLIPMSAGVIFAVNVSKILATGTTAAQIVGYR